MNFMKKYTIIVLVLFIYMAGMFAWGYTKGTATATQALTGAAITSVILVILWFLYRKRQQFRDEVKKR